VKIILKIDSNQAADENNLTKTYQVAIFHYV